jgi:flagellum-specific peptidoglycan hydrolase FlgJ
MSRYSHRKSLLYVLGVALFITFGFTNQSSYNPAGGSAAAPEKLPDHQEQSLLWPMSTISLSDPVAVAVEQPVRLAEPPAVAVELAAITLAANLISDHKDAKLEHQVHISSNKPTMPINTAPPLMMNTYEVTAYFLNVRDKPSAKSPILNVVKEGDLLEILHATDNGWLKLKNEGYIYSAYAQKVSASPINPSESESIKLSNPDKPTSKVKSESGLTETHISKIFKGTALEDQGLEEVILEIEQEYGINALFTIAVLKLESGNGKSKLAKSKNNLFGLNAIDGDAHRKAFSFKTKGDSVRKFGQLISKNYVGKGYTTIEKVAKKYCPSNEKWPALVTTIMKSDYQKL